MNKCTNSFLSTLTLKSSTSTTTTTNTTIQSPLITFKEIQYNTIENPKEQYDDIHKLLIKHIIKMRKESSLLISSILHSIILYKSAILKETIITQRHKSIIKMQSAIKGFLHHKHMKNYLDKLHCCYQIQTCLEHSNKLLMVVYLSNTKEKTFEFQYDFYANQYVIYIPRNSITESIYKVNFIADNRIIIDSSFPCENDKEKGKYINIINFAKIRKEEEDKKKVNKMTIKYIMSFIRNSQDRLYSNDSINKTEDEEYEDDDGHSYMNSSNYKERSSLCIKSVMHSSLKPSKRFLTSKGLSSLPMPIPRPKSILKNLRRQSGKDLLGIKKVKFGRTEFSF